MFAQCTLEPRFGAELFLRLARRDGPEPCELRVRQVSDRRSDLRRLFFSFVTYVTNQQIAAGLRTEKLALARSASSQN